jgi:hypothetical protein
VSFLGWVCVWFQKSVCVRLDPNTSREIAVCMYRIWEEKKEVV